MEAHCFSGESGTVVLHVVFFNPFSSAQSAVVMDGGVIRSGEVGTGKHKDILDKRNKLRSF